jgi:hypothetical protein
MNLTEFFLEIGAAYDRHDGLRTPTQELLKNASQLLTEHAPGGIAIQGSGGKGVATYTPWVGFFDPDETNSPQRGIYIVYLIAEDMESITLSLNQGMERLRAELGDAKARSDLPVMPLQFAHD